MDDKHTQDLIDAWFDGVLAAGDKAALEKALFASSAARALFWQTAQIHALLREKGTLRRGLAPGYAGAAGAAGAGWRRRAARFVKVAAAVAALAVVVAGAREARRQQASVIPPVASRLSPVEILHNWGSCNLEVPDSLPGTMRMTNGRIKARLAPGVELILLGPFELKVKGPKEATLLSGRLLAEIPATDGGFTLRTPDLEMWDYGAVYCASVTDQGSDIFVFAGEAQVVDASGEPVDICRAGEGARARRDGSGAVKVEAEVWPYAAGMLARVEDTGAAKNPEDALYVASRVSDEWARLRMPEEAWVKRERLSRIFAANAERTTKTFSKKAWARSSVPLTSKEENKMKTISAAAVLSATAVIMGTEMAGAVSESALIDTSWGDRRWTTVYTNMVPLSWDWPEPASNAELNIVGMESGLTTKFNEITTGYDWQVFTGPRPNAEDVYDLTLTFRDASDNVVEVLSARLTVVAGAFGPIAVNTSPDSRRWGLVKGNAVIPYCAGWAEATDGARDSRLIIEKSGGASQTNMIGSASGYYGWKLAGNGSVYGYGSYGLYLTFLGTEGEWDAFLTYVPKGFVMSIR